jgi:hypothetical protein
MPTTGVASQRLSSKQFWSLYDSEMSFDTLLGFWKLALLYGMLGNVLFLRLRLANEETTGLLYSGSTVVTAALAIVYLKVPVSSFQWNAIIWQMAGLIIAQYDATSKAQYPLDTYVMLAAEILLRTIAGLYHQYLSQVEKSSLHANNMMLFGSSTLFNLMVYFLTKHWKGGMEPEFFQGYDSAGPALVVTSQVLIGLATTAVYKCKWLNGLSNRFCFQLADCCSRWRCYYRKICNSRVNCHPPLFDPSSLPHERPLASHSRDHSGLRWSHHVHERRGTSRPTSRRCRTWQGNSRRTSGSQASSSIDRLAQGVSIYPLLRHCPAGSCSCCLGAHLLLPQESRNLRLIR